MMKRSHASSGPPPGWRWPTPSGLDPGRRDRGGLAGLLPDVDHPHAAVGPAAAPLVAPAHPGAPGADPLAGLVPGPGRARLVADAALNGAPVGPLLALAVLAGSLSHVLADGLTVAGVPLWWPFRRRRTVFLGALAFRTRSWPEALVVLGVVAGVGYWVSL